MLGPTRLVTQSGEVGYYTPLRHPVRSRSLQQFWLKPFCPLHICNSSPSKTETRHLLKCWVLDYVDGADATLSGHRSTATSETVSARNLVTRWPSHLLFAGLLREISAMYPELAALVRRSQRQQVRPSPRTKAQRRQRNSDKISASSSEGHK